MARIRPITRVPAKGASISPEVIIAFIIQVLTAAVPIFQNKDPQNPDDTDDTEGETTT